MNNFLDLGKIVNTILQFLWRLANAIRFAVLDYDAKLQLIKPLKIRIIIWLAIFAGTIAGFYLLVLILLKVFRL